VEISSTRLRIINKYQKHIIQDDGLTQLMVQVKKRQKKKNTQNTENLSERLFRCLHMSCEKYYIYVSDINWTLLYKGVSE
jgi:hypothetical protein